MEEKAAESSARLLHGSTYEYPQGWYCMSHTHPFFHLFYIDKGCCTFASENDVWQVAEGDCLLFPPDTSHRLIPVEGGPVSAIELMFEASGDLRQRLSSIDVRFRADALFQSLLREICAFASSRLSHIRSYVAASLLTLLHHVCIMREDSDPLHYNAQVIDISGYSRLSASVIRYVDLNYSKPISLDSISHALNYNKSYLCSVFKEECGITIKDYIDMVRIMRAVEHLSYTACDIPGVCLQVGFRNVSQFTRTFKKMLGVPPSLLKKMAPANVYDVLPREDLYRDGLTEDFDALAARLNSIQPNRRAGEETETGRD